MIFNVAYIRLICGLSAVFERLVRNAHSPYHTDTCWRTAERLHRSVTWSYGFMRNKIKCCINVCFSVKSFIRLTRKLYYGTSRYIRNLIYYLWTLYLIVLWWIYLKQQILPFGLLPMVWTCQAFYGPSEYVNLTLSLLLLTITYANRMFNIFMI